MVVIIVDDLLMVPYGCMKELVDRARHDLVISSLAVARDPINVVIGNMVHIVCLDA